MKRFKHDLPLDPPDDHCCSCQECIWRGDLNCMLSIRTIPLRVMHVPRHCKLHLITFTADSFDTLKHV